MNLGRAACAEKNDGIIDTKSEGTPSKLKDWPEGKNK